MTLPATPTWPRVGDRDVQLGEFWSVYLGTRAVRHMVRVVRVEAAHFGLYVVIRNNRDEFSWYDRDSIEFVEPHELDVPMREYKLAPQDAIDRDYLDRKRQGAGDWGEPRGREP